MNAYHTIAGSEEAEIIVKKSRFLAFVYPVTEAEQAAEMLGLLKKKHYNASHHCYAYILGDLGERMKYSDDDEPQGTAGFPILEVLKKKQLTYVLAVVVRYFGGVLLGTGGLSRAYSSAVAAAIDKAGTCEMALAEQLLIECPYALYETLERYLNKQGALIEKSEFIQSVHLFVMCPKEKTITVSQGIREITSGLANCKVLGQTLVRRSANNGCV